MEDLKKTQQLCDLFLKFKDGVLTEEEIKQLNIILLNDPEARQYYIDSAINQSVFARTRSPFADNNLFSREVWDRSFWIALAAEESSAEPIQIPKVQSKPSVPETKIIRVNRTPNKTLLFTLLASAAAFFLFALYLRFSPVQPGIETAVLSDCINAQWADAEITIEKGMPLFTSSQPMLLLEGYAKLHFRNNAIITVKGPAKFQITESDMIKLDYGQIYSTIPPEAHGFQIWTQNSKIIDLGTEFGVSQEPNGDAEVHVMKGNIVFVSKTKNKNSSMNLSAGLALSIDGITGFVEPITCKEDLFVREIDSENNRIWKGEELSLADVVGGGDGFGTGLRDSYIDPAKGRWRKNTKRDNIFDKQSTSSNEYIPVTNLNLVDGVFVPDSSQGTVHVSSKQHIFKEAPATSGGYWGGAVYGTRDPNASISLNGILLGTQDMPVLFMHSNLGITFDLNAIRKLLPNRSLTKFRSLYGISETLPDHNIEPCADFWVLVDGQLRFSKTNVTINQIDTIEIALSEEDSYLTLVTTEGAKGSPSWEGSLMYHDWCVFGKPVLIFE